MRVNHDRIAERLGSGRAGAPKGSASVSSVDHDRIAQRLASGRNGAPKGSATTQVVDHEKIERRLGVKRIVKGFAPFAAEALALDIAARLRPPVGGGRPTDPSWTQRRLVPLKPETLVKLAQVATDVSNRTGTSVEPLQIAAVVLERYVGEINTDDVESMLAGPRPR